MPTAVSPMKMNKLAEMIDKCLQTEKEQIGDPDNRKRNVGNVMEDKTVQTEVIIEDGCGKEKDEQKVHKSSGNATSSPYVFPKPLATANSIGKTSKGTEKRFFTDKQNSSLLSPVKKSSLKDPIFSARYDSDNARDKGNIVSTNITNFNPDLSKEKIKLVTNKLGEVDQKSRKQSKNRNPKLPEPVFGFVTNINFAAEEEIEEEVERNIDKFSTSFEAPARKFRNTDIRKKTVMLVKKRSILAKDSKKEIYKRQASTFFSKDLTEELFDSMPNKQNDLNKASVVFSHALATPFHTQRLLRMPSIV